MKLETPEVTESLHSYLWTKQTGKTSKMKQKFMVLAAAY